MVSWRASGEDDASNRAVHVPGSAGVPNWGTMDAFSNVSSLRGAGSCRASLSCSVYSTSILTSGTRELLIGVATESTAGESGAETGSVFGPLRAEESASCIVNGREARDSHAGVTGGQREQVRFGGTGDPKLG